MISQHKHQQDEAFLPRKMAVLGGRLLELLEDGPKY